MSITNCVYCDKLYDQDLEIEHEGVCKDEKGLEKIELQKSSASCEIELQKSDLGSWAVYLNTKPTEAGRIKDFDNNRQIAWVVFKCADAWDNYKNYTARLCHYRDLDFKLDLQSDI